MTAVLLNFELLSITPNGKVTNVGVPERFTFEINHSIMNEKSEINNDQKNTREDENKRFKLINLWILPTLPTIEGDNRKR